jgi:uncharacterized protein (DUF427 family)
VPGPGQESVWDYPRPPRVEPSASLVVVRFGGVVVAESRSTLRVLETSQAPAFYVPPADLDLSVLRPSAEAGRTWCEWKGTADYLDIVVPDELGGRVALAAGWRYPTPSHGFEAIAGHVAFYPGRVDECTVDGEVVSPNEGEFYGGWITSAVVGPFKGAAGTRGW